MWKNIRRAFAAIVVIVLIVGVYAWHDKFTVEPPNYPPIAKAVWLDQNWTAEQRDWFHHADQGTQTFGIPYEWFIASGTTAAFFHGAPALLSDPVYLDRYGFIPDKTHPGKPMPVGFAHGGPMRDASWRTVAESADKCGP